MPETVLITGASGLLGRALVSRFFGAGFQVLAQYHRHPGIDSEAVHWLAGDLSTGEGLRDFLRAHEQKLAPSQYAIHNYGPIVQKATAEVTGDDLLDAFRQQVVPALEISRFLLGRGALRSVLFIAFEYCGQVRAYGKILGYAMAKNSLLLLTRSLAAAHPNVRFNLFSPPSMKGAALLPPGAKAVAPEWVAERIFRVVQYRRSGFHFRCAAAGREKTNCHE